MNGHTVVLSQEIDSTLEAEIERYRAERIAPVHHLLDLTVSRPVRVAERRARMV